MKYHSGDQIKKNDMGRACGTYEGQEKCGGDLMKRDHLEDLGVDERIILKCIFKQWDVEAWTRLLGQRIGTAGGLL
jgi:hypothetical protein